MPENPRYPERDRTDLVLMPRQYAFSKDITKGNLTVYVGPFRTSLSETDRLIAMKNGELREVADQIEAIQSYVSVSEGEYVILTNPTRQDDKWPDARKGNDLVELAMGQKVNLPGPISFPLWPFQQVKVISGHQLQMNQYVIVRVINDKQAQENWDKAIIKPQTLADKTNETGEQSAAPQEPQQEKKSVAKPVSLSVGQLLIIRGTEVSFYIPPTGLEVVPDETGTYVREAVTLEQLEYCVLVDQNGSKRFEKGPKVVFPQPSETIKVLEEGEDVFRKFRAIELTKISGIHIKVTEPYEEGGTKYQTGEELFITGENQPIYFPRVEHAIVRYDGREIHYATAVPKGEGRYVLDRFNGNVGLVKGPQMLLPDPRQHVIVRRILSERQVSLWYPNNTEAIRVNRELAAHAAQSNISGTEYLSADLHDENISVGASAFSARRRALDAPSRLVGDDIGRKTSYTPPRTITLNTKYDGAVAVEVWTGYAILIVDKSGKRRVVEGPQTILLEFDESLAYLGLSTGKPKSTDRLKETAYLRVLNNRVSDIVSIETRDKVEVNIKLSYRVNFTGDKDKWFDVDNYVKLLCDHARSLIRNGAKKVGIEEFDTRYIDLIRDIILGQSESTDGEKKKRKGLLFEENGMHVYDVEILGRDITNGAIASLLTTAQHETVKSALSIAARQRELASIHQEEAIAQEKDALVTETALKKYENQQMLIKATLDVALAELNSSTSKAVADLKMQQEKEKVKDFVHGAELERRKLSDEQALESKKAELVLVIERIAAETKELVERTKAITPEMIASLQAFSDKETIQKIAHAMAPMSLLGGESVVDILAKLLKGTGLENLLPAISNGITSRMNLPAGSVRP